MPQPFPTATVPVIHLRDELLSRRARLDAVRAAGATFPVAGLLAEIDAALHRLESGTYGLCQTCHDPIEADRLIADPLACFCLDHLTPQQRALHERDMELARSIQRALLPPNDVAIAGWQIHYAYEPAGAVSGDYCDIITTAAAGANVAVGDVSGKGVSASILMSNLHAMFRSLAAAGVPFADAVSRVNHIFCASTLPSSFATIAVARLDPEGVVDVCSAGHCPPLIVRGSRVEEIPPTGPAVGLICDAQFGIVRHRLLPGEMMVLYSDGLTETFDADGAEYGAERLARVVGSMAGAGPRDVARACLEDVASFAAGSGRRDDLTLMTIRRA